MTVKFAKRIDNLQASEIRELLKLTQRPEIISFAGGLPAPDLFPVKEIAELAKDILLTQGTKVLQYATTEGHAPLREKIAEYMCEMGISDKITADNLLITTGSQQGLDFTGKIFLNDDDVVLCESPSYLGAINAFKAYQPKFIEVDTDAYGMIPESLEKIMATEKNVKFLYAIPDFQNPTGITWSVERRQQIMEICNRYDLPVIEDNPYGDLRYEGERPPSLMSFDKKQQVVFLGTFSKSFCPGLRIGWVAGFGQILRNYITVKQSADLHTSTLDQCIVDAFMEKYTLKNHVPKICALYKERRDIMLQALADYMPEGVTFTKPEGGLFIWLTMPSGINSREVFVKCIENNVAFVPGDAFYPVSKKMNSLRLNFSNMPEERIVEGIKRLATAIKTFIV